jgi:cysteine-rich repeat protein
MMRTTGRRATWWGSRIAAQLTAVALVAVAPSALAVRPPSYLLDRPTLEVANGPAVRPQRLVTWNVVPPRAQPGWDALARELGPGSQASWDTVTGVPTRIYGAGIPAPGAMASAAIAEKLARAFVERHLGLLAPGEKASDLVLVSNELSGGQRTVGFAQLHRGMPVLGGQLGVSFRNDRLFVAGSLALPRVQAEPPAAVLEPEAARIAAAEWLADGALGSFAALGTGAVEGPLILPLVGSARVHTPVVVRVMVDTAQPAGRWAVYLDAQSGARVAREQLLRFANGTLLYNAPVRYPGAGRQDYPAAYASLWLDGIATSADPLGTVSWPTAVTASLLTSASGNYATVQNAAGANAQDTLALAPDGSAVWSAPGNEQRDAQISAYTHANVARTYVRAIDPDAAISWLDSTLPITVNVADVCNAYSDGQTITFFQSGGGCENSARLSDVVYHEWAHTLHIQAVIPGVGSFEGGLSEGLSDFLAATMANDSGIGRGFFYDDSPLRELNPQGYEYTWPTDLGEVHQTGLIIGGALWDLRKALSDKLGVQAGVAHTDFLWLQALRRAVDIPSTYVEMLAADDDDGNLDNGTPNLCEINRAFGLHGLRPLPVIKNELGVVPPGLDGYRVVLAPLPLTASCPGDGAPSAEVEWRLRSSPGSGGVIPMVASNGALEAQIPPQDEGSVVQYRLKAIFGEGAVAWFPGNPADPYYEFFVGAVEPIYCTGFETDPWAAGWTHGTYGGAGDDDWQWGAPQAPPASTDPPTAYAGAKVLGTDLGLDASDGKYTPDVYSFATSPTVDVSGYPNVRLQYRRWLNIEDGYYDTARISANGMEVWRNFDSEQEGGGVNHSDKEWRFHDADLSAAAAGGQVHVTFELLSDPGLELGGWNIDQLCIVGVVSSACGDGTVTGLEQCDEGPNNSDTEPDACRTDCQAAGCGDGVEDTGEECDDGNGTPGDGCEPDCTRSPDGPFGPDAGPQGWPAGTTVIDNGCGCRLGARPALPRISPWWALAGWLALRLGRGVRQPRSRC